MITIKKPSLLINKETKINSKIKDKIKNQISLIKSIFIK